VTLGGVLVMGGAGTAEAATFRIRSCPYTINTPGTYVLATDLICPGLGRAVTVAANNVRLLLGSHTLDGQNLGDAGIFAEGVTGLSVEGGTLTRFDYGVSLGDTPGARVLGVNASGGNEFGISVGGCAGCRIVGNRTNGNEEDGIDVLSSPDARIIRNTATDNGFDGIAIVEGSTGDRLKRNRAAGSGHFDLYDGNLPTCVNTWRRNRFTTDNEGDGPGRGCIR